MFNPPKIELKNKIINTIINKSDKVDFIFLIESSFEFTKDLINFKGLLFHMVVLFISCVEINILKN